MGFTFSKFKYIIRRGPCSFFHETAIIFKHFEANFNTIVSFLGDSAMKQTLTEGEPYFSVGFRALIGEVVHCKSWIFFFPRISRGSSKFKVNFQLI
jgi:hypothetical protein